MKQTLLSIVFLVTVTHLFGQGTVKIPHRSLKNSVVSIKKTSSLPASVHANVVQNLKNAISKVKTRDTVKILKRERQVTYYKLKRELKKTVDSIRDAERDAYLSDDNRNIILTSNDTGETEVIMRNYESEKDQLNEFLSEHLLLAYRYTTLAHNLQFFPAKNADIAALNYDENNDKVVQTLQNGFLNFTSDGGMIYSELASGYAGPLRLSFGGMIASSKLAKIDSTALLNTPADKVDSLISATDSINRKTNSIKNLLGGGGNAMLVITTPLFNFHPGKVFNLSSTLFDKNCFSIPALGNQLTKYSYVNGAGIQVDARFMFENASISTFGFFVTASQTMLYGNKDFYSNLGLTSSKMLSFTEIKFGLLVDRFTIYFSYNHIDDASLQAHMQNTIGTSIVPFGK